MFNFLASIFQMNPFSISPTDDICQHSGKCNLWLDILKYMEYYMQQFPVHH